MLLSQSQQVLSSWQTQPGSSHLHLLCILWGSCSNPETSPDLFAGGAMSHIFVVGLAAQKKKTTVGQIIWMFHLFQSLGDSLGYAEVRKGLSVPSSPF